MTPVVVLLVLAAGALGAVLRWAAARRLPARGELDRAVLLVNMSGSFLAGTALGCAPLLPPAAVLVVVTGLGGGLTTFGTLTVLTAAGLREGRSGAALRALTLQLLLGVAAGALGLATGLAVAALV